MSYLLYLHQNGRGMKPTNKKSEPATKISILNRKIFKYVLTVFILGLYDEVLNRYYPREANFYERALGPHILLFLLISISKFRLTISKFRLSTKFRHNNSKFRLSNSKFRLNILKFRLNNSKFRLNNSIFRLNVLKFRHKISLLLHTW